MTRQAWTISEIAQRCGVSKSTVRRYREAERFPNAWKDEAQQWRIPLEDLLAVGWKPVDPDRVSSPAEYVSTPSERERELESLLAVERARREAAERVAAMAEQNADDLRRAMRILEGTAVRQPEPVREVPVSVTPDVPVSAPEPTRQRRWWHLT